MMPSGIHSAGGKDGRGVEGSLDPSLDLGSGEHLVTEPTEAANDRRNAPEFGRPCSELR